MPSAECRLRPRTPPEQIKREGWQNDGILVVHVEDDRLTWPERELVRQLGDKLHGPGKHSSPEGARR